MNQQRLRSYIKLIQQLLACPSGEEWILLRQNEALVTPELVQVMEQVAMQLANQGNRKEAKFLHNLAGQIHHLFVSKTIQMPETEDNSQAYLELIKALLACPKGSEDELLTANQALVGPGLVQMMQQVAAQLLTNGDQETANYLQHWAMELNRRWLQEHDFQPSLKQESEPHPSEPAPTTRSSVPSATPPSAPSSRPSVPEEEEDLWAELSDEATSNASPPQPSPPPVPVEAPPAPVQAGGYLPLPSDLAIYAQIDRHLETIAVALTQLSAALNPPAQSPTNPLWYMEVLERALAENWVLTSSEIHTLIGVQPICHHESDSFQRGCWIFVKAGKVGGQIGWRVKKDQGEERAEG